MKKQKTISIEWCGDKEYIRQRNELIPIAVKHANAAIGNRSVTEWDRAFHRKMNALSHDRIGCLL